MDPKLSEQLQQTLAALLANAQDAAAWTKGQLPLLVQEKILFGRINETVQLLIVMGALAFCLTLCYRCVLKLIDGEYQEEIGYIISIGATGFASIGLFILFATQLDLVMKVWFAPRLYIVEWLMSQVHK